MDTKVMQIVRSKIYQPLWQIGQGLPSLCSTMSFIILVHCNMKVWIYRDDKLFHLLASVTAVASFPRHYCKL